MFSLLFCVTCKVFIAYHNPLAVEYKSYVDTVNMCVVHVCMHKDMLKMGKSSPVYTDP